MSKYIEKYPWLRTLNLYTGTVENEYDAMDDMPDGWRIAFGDMLCEELDAAIKKENAVDTFYIAQLKEKFGALRIYPSGYNDEIRDIIRKYETLSQNICVHCGQPDVNMTYTGWQIPLCKDCFDNHVNDTREYDQVISSQEKPQMANEMKWRTYSNESKKWIEHSIDISKTAEKIRENWQKSTKNLFQEDGNS